MLYRKIVRPLCLAGLLGCSKKLTGYTTIGKGNYFLVNLGLYWCIICVLKNLCHNTVNLQYKKLLKFIENILNKLISLFNKRGLDVQIGRNNSLSQDVNFLSE